MPTGISPPSVARPDALTLTIPGLVWAFRIAPDGVPRALSVDDAIDLSPSDGLLWLHFNLADARSLKWLEQAHLKITRQALALLISKDSHQQIHSDDDHVFGVLSDLLRDIDAATQETGYLRFVMTEPILISGRHHALCAVDATRRALENGHRIHSAASLLEAIVENVASAMEGIADRTAVALDDIEDVIPADGSKDSMQRLGQIRRTCVRIHRQLSGLRIVFHRLEHQGVNHSKPALQLRAAKLAQRLDGLDHRIVEMRERSRLLQEELHLLIEEKSNDSLRVLSVLTALLLPPTLVTGIFGMNTKGLPLTDIELGFAWAGLLIVASSISAYLVMRRIGLVR